MITHEQWQEASYRDFLAAHLLRNRRAIPKATKGIIKPVVNHGRWLVDCPTCGAAVVVSDTDSVYVCPECGSPENDGQFYNVVFPADRVGIERELDKRLLKNRNWDKETIAELIAENQAKGVK